MVAGRLAAGDMPVSPADGGPRGFGEAGTAPAAELDGCDIDITESALSNWLPKGHEEQSGQEDRAPLA